MSDADNHDDMMMILMIWHDDNDGYDDVEDGWQWWSVVR